MEFLLCMKDLGDYDAGDIVDIRPDDFDWGKNEKENTSTFKVIRVPDEEASPKGESLKDTIAFYMDKQIVECLLCHRLISNEALDVHLAVIHDGLVATKVAAGNLTKGVKNREWKFDLDNGVLLKKTPDDQKIGDIKLQAEFDFTIEHVT